MKEFKSFALTSLLLTLAACGSPNRQPSSTSDINSIDSGIIGGSEVASSDSLLKSTVGLVLIKGDTQAICTGTLVAKDVVLTAAHCMEDIDKAVVVYGPDIEKAAHSKKFFPVTHSFIHPSYSIEADKDSHDIALVKFSGSLPAGFKTAELLGDANQLKQGLSVTLAGYGASEEKNGELSGAAVLRKTTVPLSNPEFSKTEISFSSASGSGACHGDSGGPAYANINGKTVLIGVTSRTTDKKGGCHKDSVYTNVAAYKDLIEQTATQLENER